MTLRYSNKNHLNMNDIFVYLISFIVLIVNFGLLNIYKTKISNIPFLFSLLFLAYCFKLLKCSCRATLISFYALIVPYLYISLYSYVSSADFYDFLCLNMLSEDKKISFGL